MRGPAIVARSLTPIRPFGKGGYRGQYHQQSDYHSKVMSWALLFDLYLESKLLREHAAAGKVIAGVNHVMRDFTTARKKALDLVIARPADPGHYTGPTFSQLAIDWDLRLSPEDGALLAGLPQLRTAVPGAVLVAVEAKAAMTAHTKAKPRLYDELNSSHATVHGAADQAIAVAGVIVNAGPKFLTLDKNEFGVATIPPLRFQLHNQPGDANGIVAKLRELPRRTTPGMFGFDALGVTMLDIRNDGSDVEVVTGPPGLAITDDLSYEQMVRRVVALYDYRFNAI